MYGLVNRAIEDLVTQGYGSDVWERIKREADVDIDVFVRMEAYPDDISYRLIAAASKVLDQSADQILGDFGRFWPRYTGREGYGEILDAAGSSLWEFLFNLDELHSRVGLIYPNLQPPSFSCTDVTDQSLELHYYSERAGLAPMVVGLLEGLSLIFDTPVLISRTQCKEEGADHDAFRITKIVRD
jgi:hypothetical protein